MSRGTDRVSVGEAELLGRYFFLSRKAAEGELSTRGYEELERAKGALSRNPRLENLKERFRIIYEDDLDVSPTKYQPSEAEVTEPLMSRMRKRALNDFFSPSESRVTASQVAKNIYSSDLDENQKLSLLGFLMDMSNFESFGSSPLVSRPTKDQPSEAEVTEALNGFFSPSESMKQRMRADMRKLLASRPTKRSNDAEVMNFSDRDDIMDAEIDMKPSMPIVEQEAVPGSEVSIGGQTYRLPRDPTAASRYQQSLLDQQAAKDAETETNFRASSELKDLEGRPPFDTMTESSLLADIRSTPSYDQGFRAGLNLRGEKPNLADDLMNLSYDADAVRRDIVKNYSGMGAAQVDDPGLIFLLGHAEAMEFAKREKEDVERDVLQQGILIEGDPIYEMPR
jgi:hypothetical protein|tara:strand:+ start:218 stop:1405 length:1188 start_codon:yes stop_codon:yes gene_type:complete